MGKWLILTGLFVVFIEHSDILLDAMVSIIGLLLMIIGLMLETAKDKNFNNNHT